MMFLILLPFIIASIVLIIAEPAFYVNGCYGCAFSPAGLYVLVFTASGILIFALITSIRIRNFPDPFGIVQECRWSFLFGGSIAILFFALDKWESLRANPYFSWIIPEIFGVLIMFFVHGPLQLMMGFREERRDRLARAKLACDGSPRSGYTSTTTHQQQQEQRGQSSSAPSLEDVLEDPSGIVAFEKFLISIWASESLRFYIEAREWTLNFHDIGYRTALSRARRIVRVFIDLNGSMTVNLEHGIVDNLKLVLDEGSLIIKIGQHFFDEAISEILKLMRIDGFFRFRETPDYATFAAEWANNLGGSNSEEVQSETETPIIKGVRLRTKSSSFERNNHNPAESSFEQSSSSMHPIPDQTSSAVVLS